MLVWIHILLIFLIFPHGSKQEEESIADDVIEIDDSSLRLPKNLKPVHYLVRLQPYIGGNFSIDGYLEMTFEVTKSTDEIILHIDDIITKNETVKVSKLNSPEETVSVTNQTYDSKRQFYIVSLEKPLEQFESYTLVVEFIGYLNEDLKGFYRSSYVDDDGNTVWLANTQFQPTEARKAFPCMDEPAFKAKFTIEIARQEHMRSVSNMPRAAVEPLDGHDGWYWDKFNTTLPMSTYLVGFVVSDFTYIEANDTDTDYDFRIWARKQMIDQAHYALDVGTHVLKFYEEYFNVPFPLPKQDMVALIDFNFGAMENWGIVMYREARLLADPMMSKASDKMVTGSIIAHELAHMWFGDLVTPEWWTDLWLNEGFASYLQLIGYNNYDPAMELPANILVEEQHISMALDCLETSHPISQPVNNPDEINETFDVIAYSKGASIIRMLSNFLTENTFRKALSKYLTDLSYNNARQDQLWYYLTEQAHIDKTLEPEESVKEIMDTWTLQMGYPVVNIAKNDDGSVTVSQNRFLLINPTEPNAESNSEQAYSWWVPLSYTTSSELDFVTTTAKDWLAKDENNKTIANVMDDDEKWMLFNIGETGYYRVNYEEENWLALTEQLKENHTVIVNTNRAQILNDAFNLARAGQLTYTIPLNILGYLKSEENFVPLKTALTNLQYIRDMLFQDEKKEDLKDILKKIVVPLYERIGFEDDLSSPLMEQRLRSEVVSAACGLGHLPCLESAVGSFKEWMQNPNDTSMISPNVKSTVLCVGISEGGDEEWQFAWGQYLNTLVSSEKNIILAALGCSQDRTILRKFLDLALSPDGGIKKQDASIAILSVAKNDENGRVLTWEFIRDEWAKIADYYGTVTYTLGRIMEGVTKNLNTQDHLQQLKDFRVNNRDRLLSARRAVDQAIENVQNNVQWMNSNAEIIENWISETTKA